MFIKLYLIALPVFLAIDILWVGFLAKSFYAGQIGHLLKPNVSWTAAILFYLIFIAGLVLFVIMPGIERGSLMQIMLYGAFFGLVAYATYDLTNLALTKDWPVLVTVVDMMWGALIASIVSLVTYAVATKTSFLG